MSICVLRGVFGGEAGDVGFLLWFSALVDCFQSRWVEVVG